MSRQILSLLVVNVGTMSITGELLQGPTTTVLTHKALHNWAVLWFPIKVAVVHKGETVAESNGQASLKQL